MKRRNFMMLCILSIVFLLILTFASASVQDIPDESIPKGIYGTHHLSLSKFPTYDIAPVSKLPASLRVIDDEAFEGTSFIAIEIPDGVIHIGEKAFADISSLKLAKLPSDIERIAPNIFAGSRNVTLTAAPRSQAKTLAQKAGIPFIPIATIDSDLSETHVFVSFQRQKTSINLEPCSAEHMFDETPSFRPINEIHEEQFKQCIAHCIIGRAPPVVSI